MQNNDSIFPMGFPDYGSKGYSPRTRAGFRGGGKDPNCTVEHTSQLSIIV